MYTKREEHTNRGEDTPDLEQQQEETGQPKEPKAPEGQPAEKQPETEYPRYDEVPES